MRTMLERVKIRLEMYEVVEKEIEKEVEDEFGNVETVTEIVKEIVFDDSEDFLLEEIIDGAKWRYINVKYPTTPFPADENGEPVIDRRWQNEIVEVSIRIYSKIGAEGQLSHTENSISRAFESESSWLERVTPVVGVMR